MAARLLVIAGLALFVFGCGGSGSGTVALPYETDFSDDCEAWSTQDDDELAAGCDDGDYTVQIRSADNTQVFTLPVEADTATVETTLRLASGALPQLYGLGCFDETKSGYWLGIAADPDGRRGLAIIRYEIVAAEAGLASAETLAHKVLDSVDDSREHRLSATCDGTGLRMTLDGATTIAATQKNALGAIRHVGFVIVPAGPGSEVRYSSFSAS